MHTDFDNLRDAARDALHALEREREQMEERAQRLEIFYKLTEHMKEMLAENEKLEEENERPQGLSRRFMKKGVRSTYLVPKTSSLSPCQRQRKMPTTSTRRRFRNGKPAVPTKTIATTP